ncbi:fibrinogen gamma chain isoform X1 [Takifugu flavidus]|uniref:fibrinogen gamma chain isoform X1 n=1 Tax=Takifugu flavidus TaxID=433684 RepID=UPI0025448001|nr:fibrinogen gamma chain isoform X1 [Takifugu flavidus]
MFPSLLATAGGLLLLFSLSSAVSHREQRGDSSAATVCVANDGFGMYCPTTCGVADYMLKYFSKNNDGLEQMLIDLENIANMTQDAENRVVYMKDSMVAAQKSITPDIYIKKSSSMLDDVYRFEKTISVQEQQIIELQNTVSSNERRMSELKQLSLQLQQKCSEPCKDSVEIQPISGTDCQDIANKGATTSGLYYVKPQKATEQFLVYCEIDAFGRGFTVIQRRRDGSVDFKKDWIQYREGFGYLSPDDTTEFWLGNEKIHLLTTSTTMPTVLRIELVDWEGNKKYADYNMFRIGSEADKYRLTYGFYFGGDAGDAFDGYDFGDDPSDKSYTSHNGMQFSTFDSDNDRYDGNCAQQDGSGWWMNRCHAAHLNGKYYSGGRYSEKDAGEFGFDNGIIWVTWHSRWYSLKETTMKLIPLSRLAAGGQTTGVKEFGGLGL